MIVKDFFTVPYYAQIEKNRILVIGLLVSAVILSLHLNMLLPVAASFARRDILHYGTQHNDTQNNTRKYDLTTLVIMIRSI